MAAYHGLLAIERSDVNLKINLLALGVTMVAAWFMLTTWGVFGAAFALLLGNIVSTFVKCFCFLQLVKRNLSHGSEIGESRPLIIDEVGSR